MADSILGVESHTDITGSMLPHAELRDGQAAERQHDAHAAAALQKDAVTGVHHLLLPPALADLEDERVPFIATMMAPPKKIARDSGSRSTRPYSDVWIDMKISRRAPIDALHRRYADGPVRRCGDEQSCDWSRQTDRHGPSR